MASASEGNSSKGPANSSISFIIPEGAYTIIQVSTAVGGAGIIINGLALIIIFIYTDMWKKVGFYLLVNQIVVDFTACVTITAQYVSIISGDPTMTFFAIRTENDALCRAWYSKALLWSLANSSNYNVVMVTCERYLKILHPHLYNSLLNKVYI